MAITRLLLGLVLLATMVRHLTRVKGIHITDATIGLTPVEDPSSGFGRLYMSYNLDGSYNAFVFWISDNDPSGEPFTFKNGAFTFLPGSYDHYVGTQISETLTISQVICCEDIFSFNGGQYVFTLPSTIAPSLSNSYATDGGDKHYLYNVPVLVGAAAPLPKLATLKFLGMGLGLVIVCWVYFRDRRRR